MCKPEWGRARVRAQRLAELTRLRRVRDRIDREFARPLDVEALAREVNMSAGQLSRQFRAAYGESPYGYLMKRRIERATVLLGRGGLGVTEVCSAVGCASPGAFTSRFTELVGVPPGAFVAGRVPGPVRNREAPAAARLVA
ncbi:helix-turn-helix transcriptional regulator [Streptomyces sp. NPDC059525]|uniref:helix-turn-helix transcriptional regulator n=1 Tax=Streptomyces sp. NPDC059525 TaxID=3346857 RepID=UPI00369F1CAE